MLRTLISMVSLLTLMAFVPAFAADGDKAAEKTACETSCCSTTCSKCLKVCQDALVYCKKKGGEHAKKEHLDTLKDCIALCRASSDLAGRKSALAAKVHAICAEACRKCAESCKSLNDKKLDNCVEQCNTCADACEKASR
ncbi:hypothetical protein GC174_10885 [bacterium]|nr:hypothetical protein [bacterium]